MIFITVGTHEQPFNRLLEEIDFLIEKGFIKDDVYAQIGYSTYTPKHFEYKKMLSYEEMQNYFKNASIVITHGGPSSFMEALKFKKIPVVVPRQKDFNEHINDHQLEFCNELVKRKFPILVVENIKELDKAIEKVKNTSFENLNFKYNNSNFVKTIEEECEALFK